MLSAEAFAEIVIAYAKAGEVDPVHKNRRAMRVQHNARTLIYRIGVPITEAKSTVQMRDISARGCSFTCADRLPIASNFVIQFSRKNQSPSGVLCTVVHCRNATDGYRIGAEFTCALDAKSTARATNLSDLDRIRNSILT